MTGWIVIEDDYMGGPLTAMPSTAMDPRHWLDMWSQVCGRCGHTVEDIENFGLQCVPEGPDYMRAVREAVAACR